MNAQARPQDSAVLPLLLLAISWLPVDGLFQLIAYGAPIAVFVLGLFFGWARITLFALASGLLLLALALISLLVDPYPALLPNVALSALTYGSIALLGLRTDTSDRSWQNFVRGIAVLTILEFLVGFGQLTVASGGLVFRSMGVGDHVVGTLRTHSHLYTIKMLVQAVILMIAALYGMRSKLVWIGLAAGVLGGVLGSALMVTVLFAAGMAVLLMCVPARLLPPLPYRGALMLIRVIGVIAIFAGAALLNYTQPANVRYITYTLNKAYSALQGKGTFGYRKLRAAADSLELMADEPKVFYLGTGPGHYSSRSAMILTGGYLMNQNDVLPVSRSPYTSWNIYPLWNPEIYNLAYQDGVMNQPFFSLQSLLLEWGLIGASVMIVLYLALYRSLLLRSAPGALGACQFAGIAMLVICPVLFISDNWLEYPSFMIPIWTLLAMGLSLRPAASTAATGSKRLAGAWTAATPQAT